MKIHVYILLGMFLCACADTSIDGSVPTVVTIEMSTQKVVSAITEEVDAVLDIQTPSSLFTATILPTETKATVSEVETQEPEKCVLPCMFEIRVGQTSFQKYVNGIEDTNTIEFNVEIDNWQYYRLKNTYGLFSLLVQNDLIISISNSDSELLNKTPKELLLQEGAPDELWMVPFNEATPNEVSDLFVVLIYEQRGIVVKYYSYTYQGKLACFRSAERRSTIFAPDEKYGLLENRKPHYFDTGDYLFKYKKFQEGDVITPQSFYEAMITDECIEVNLGMWKE